MDDFFAVLGYIYIYQDYTIRNLNQQYYVSHALFRCFVLQRSFAVFDTFKKVHIHKTKYSRICIVEKLKYVFGTSWIYTHTCNVHSFVFQNKVQIELTLYTSRHRWHETCVNNFEFILQKCTIDESKQKSSKKIHEPKPIQLVKSKPRKSCG